MPRAPFPQEKKDLGKFLHWLIKKFVSFPLFPIFPSNAIEVSGYGAKVGFAMELI